MPGDATQKLDATDSVNTEAVRIYQDHLDTLSDCLLSGDFDRFRERISLPHSVKTLTADFIIPTVDEMRTTFANVHQGLKYEGATHLVRIVKFAEFETPSVIIGEHETHRMRDAHRLVDPYLNRVRLEKQDDGHWRETHCTNAIRSKAGKLELAEHPREPQAAPELQILSERKKT